MSVNQYEIGNEHPADQAMRAEQSSSPSATALTPEELAHYSRMNPADLVAGLANSQSEVPKDSPLHKLTNDQLRNEMTKAMGAIGDFRKSQSQVGHLEQLSAAVSANPTTQGLGDFLTASAEAGQSSDQSQRSARRVGLGDYEYDQAVRQLAEIMDPSASSQAAQPTAAEQAADPNGVRTPAPANGQPYEINKGADGSYVVTIDTGERFRGKNADEVIEKLTHSKRKTGIWGRDLNRQLSELRSGNGAQPSPQTSQPQAAAVNADPASLITDPDIAEKFARSVGFSDAQEMIGDYQRTQQQLQEMQSKLEAANQFASKYEDEQLAERFVMENPDFPGTAEATAILEKIMDSSDLDWSKPENLSLAHQHAIRKGLYRPLTTEEIRVANGERLPTQARSAPPTPPPSGAPDNGANPDPWRMATDDLRKRVLEGGGLGRALLDMAPGSSLGGQ